jgi:hypothetical protein
MTKMTHLHRQKMTEAAGGGANVQVVALTALNRPVQSFLGRVKSAHRNAKPGTFAGAERLSKIDNRRLSGVGYRS